MPPASLPPNEVERLIVLRSYDVLDTACEASFNDIAKLAVILSECPIALVSLVDADRQCFKGRQGLDVDETPREVSFCAHAILHPGEVLMVPDATLDPRFRDNPLIAEIGLRFYAGVPLVNAEGIALGTLCVIDRVPRRLNETQQEALRYLAGTVVTTLELRRTMHKVRQAALTDTLTGIANRPALLNALHRAIALQQRDGPPFSLVYLDLDGFKRINDLHGHATGDEVLRQVAATLSDCARHSDMAARLGGDEFAVLLAGQDAAPAAGRIRQQVEAEMERHGWPVTASVGAVSFRDAPADVEEALSAADELMYGAKFAGKNRVLHREFASRPRAHRAA
ncbi:sensor domain-containing diguanylate cyclase [Teichococcus oryzae]|nr:sensor domain-containing diguanylate cyclase [Pseudoroseomonas oryzae]